VRAPFPGTIYKTEVKVGATVHTGDLVLAIADLERLRVRANIDQVDLGKVKAGQQVQILSNAHPGRKWSGKVTEVIPHVQLKQNRAISEALAEVTAPVEGLVPGMTVDVEVVVASAEDALQIPSESVFNDDHGRPVAYAIDGSQVRERPIRLGLISAKAVQVTDGLTAGTAVVLGPAPGIHDGMHVRIEPAHGG